MLNICERGLRYLQAKGLLNSDFQLDLDSPRCHSMMPEMILETSDHMLEDAQRCYRNKNATRSGMYNR